MILAATLQLDILYALRIYGYGTKNGLICYVAANVAVSVYGQLLARRSPQLLARRSLARCLGRTDSLCSCLVAYFQLLKKT
jgi:hypothetical protein